MVTSCSKSVLFSTCNYNSIKLNPVCSSCSVFNNLGKSAGMASGHELHPSTETSPANDHLSSPAKEGGGSRATPIVFFLPRAAWGRSRSCLRERPASPGGGYTGPITAPKCARQIPPNPSHQTHILKNNYIDVYVDTETEKKKTWQAHQEVLCKLNNV